MSNHRHGQPPHSKPAQSSGIRPPDYQALTKRIEDLEKLVKAQFDEKNQWNSQVRDWIGKDVAIQLIDTTTVKGTLRWMDRYTVCIDELKGVAIVHKGSIAVIRLNP